MQDVPRCIYKLELLEVLTLDDNKIRVLDPMVSQLLYLRVWI